MSISSIEQLVQLFAAHGVRTLYFKNLATKQDNEKNQIYLGGGLDGISNLFATEIGERSASQSIKKRASSAGQRKLEAKIRLAWLDVDGAPHEAPNARIVDYFQYPEVRLSGFLKGCVLPPDSLRRARQARYRKRILALGNRPDGIVLGYVLTERDDPLTLVFPVLPTLPAAEFLRVLPIAAPIGSTPRELLLDQLKRVVQAGWHQSKILKTGSPSPVPFIGAQGGGYTLEAMLGVCANARKEPDCHGYEIKAYGGSRISLMTPSPDGGFQGTRPFREFMNRFGSDGRKKGTRRFSGVFSCTKTNTRTRMRLVLRGYDPKSDNFADASKVRVDLVHEPTGSVVASWSLAHLANSWNRKHASALYIEYKRQQSSTPGHDFDYQYADRAHVGEGTDVWRLLRAIYSGIVFYDPAHSIYESGVAKIRPQWRINTSSLDAAMRQLYAETVEVPL